MSIAEYKEQLTQLSRHAHHLVSTETMKVRRFVRGLVNPLFSNLFPMIGKMSYTEIMDVVYGLEFGMGGTKSCQGVRQEAENERILF